jgi:hypothetical protein
MGGGTTQKCRAVSRYNKLYKVASCWIYIGIFLRCTDPWTLNVVTVLQIYFSVTLSLSAMQIHNKFVQLITVLISQCVTWMTASVSFMRLFPSGVRQLFKSKVRRTSYIARREQIAKLQTEVGGQISLWKCIFFHCFSFSQTMPYCSYRAGVIQT